MIAAGESFELKSHYRSSTAYKELQSLQDESFATSRNYLCQFFRLKFFPLAICAFCYQRPINKYHAKGISFVSEKVGREMRIKDGKMFLNCTKL